MLLLLSELKRASNDAQRAHLALLCEDLFEVKPSFSPHVAVTDVSQLGGGVAFGSNLFGCSQVVQRLKHNKTKCVNMYQSVLMRVQLWGGG